MAEKATLMRSDPAYRIQAADKREKAVRLRLEGLRWDQIAEQCGYLNGRSAADAVQQALAEHLKSLDEAVNEYRMVELARLEELIRSHWEKATSGEDYKAAELVLKIIDRLARLTGTEQPVKLDVTGGVTYEVVGWTPPQRPELGG